MIGSVNSGTKVTIKEKLGDWYKVSVKIGGVTREAYVFAKYVTKTGGSTGNNNTDNNTNSNPSTGGTLGTVNTAALNVRSRPGTSYTRIDCIGKGTEVTILSESGGWYRISFGKKTGYVSAQYITKKSGGSTNNNTGNNNGSGSTTEIKNKLGIVNTSALNVRSKATTASSVVTCLLSGTKVTVESSQPGWYKIKTTVGGKSYSG